MTLKYDSDGVNKFGRNPDVDTALEDIWDGGGTYVFPTQARLHALVSDDAADDGKATGTVTLLGALAGDIFTLNGRLYTAVAGAKTNNKQFSIDGSDTVDAADLVDSINNDSRTPVTVPTAVVVASSAAGVVTINVDGAIGNLVDLSSSNGVRLAVSGATLADVGTGAQAVEIEGIGADGKEATETVFLNGTVAVNTTKTYQAINRMHITLAGSGGENAGVITATAAVDGTVSAQINIGNNQTEMAIFMVRSDRDLFLTQYYLGVGKQTAAFVDGDLLIQLPGEPFQLEHSIPASSTGSTDTLHPFNPWKKVPAGSKIRMRAISSAVNAVVFGGFDGNFSIL